LAENGARAVEVYQEAQAQISLCVLDLQMPVMDGVETLEALRAINPKLRVLIASGYGRDARVEAMLTNRYTGFVQKPYELAVLSAKVAEAVI
jgi:CheY-like chemotaxis protein